MPDPVARRLVFHVAGYDPMSAETAHHRFSRELARFRSTWGLAAEAGSLTVREDVATWPVSATGRDWSFVHRGLGAKWDTPLTLGGPSFEDLTFSDSRHATLVRGGQRCLPIGDIKQQPVG